MNSPNQHQYLELPDSSSRIEIVRLGDIGVPDYQRTAGLRSAIKVRDQFDPRLFDVMTVSRRKDKSMWLIDGLQRKTGRESSPNGRGEDTRVFARILEGLTVAEEVYLFEKLNKDRVRVNAFNIFQAQLSAGEPEAEMLNTLVNSVDGLTIGPSHSKDTVGSVATLQEVAGWKDGLEILREALVTARIAYPGDSKQLHGQIVGGLAVFLRQLRKEGVYNKAWKGPEDLAQRIRNNPASSTPGQVFTNAKGAASAAGGGMSANRVSAGIFATAWNKGRRAGPGDNRVTFDK